MPSSDPWGIDMEPWSALRSLSLAVLGYGSQGRSHALNLRDRGLDVRVGLRRESPRWRQAEEEGLRVEPLAEAARADLLVMALPDAAMGSLYREVVAPVLKDEAALVFLHGFAVTYGAIPRSEGRSFLLVAPKAIGPAVRHLFSAGQPIAALVAAEPVESGPLAEAYALAIGASRDSLYWTSFREETEADLFGEQAVLCGGVPALLRAAFDTLVEGGFRPEVAYFECVHELKLIVDLVYERGLAGMERAISDTAFWGGRRAARALIDEDFRSRLRGLLRDVQSGAFAREWSRASADSSELASERNRTAEDLIELAGERIRRNLGLSPSDV